MPRVTEAHAEARRDQILAAAAACFARDGFHRTTVDDICRQAGLSPGAVYSYFSSKEDIVEALALEMRRASVERIEAARNAPTTEGVLDALAASFFPFLDTEEGGQAMRLSVQLWSEALRNPRVLAAMRANLDSTVQPFAAIIRRGQERGETDPALDPLSVARIMVALFQGLLLQKSLDPSVDVAAYVDAMKKSFSLTRKLEERRHPERRE